MDDLDWKVRKRMAAKFGKSTLRKGTDILRASEGRLHLLPFGKNILRLQDSLGELGSVRLFLFGGILPFRFKTAQRLKRLAFLPLNLVEQSKLLRCGRPALEDAGLHDRERHAAVVLRHGNGHAKRIADLPGLP